ncbi:MAG: hypothetical protein KF784_02225 [Fimbriimonadaceae bacterium]|nr:hypothetical protein [Fimbriimonadaceae bacterium]
MANLGFNQTPIEPYFNVNGPITLPAEDKMPERTASRRAIASALGVRVWRIGDFLQDGFPPSVTTTVDNLEETAIRALCEFLIVNGHKAVLVFGNQAIPNNAAYRSATGGDSVWAQVNFGDHNMVRMPAAAWETRWAYQKAILDRYKDYFLRREKRWEDYIELELTNEPSKITTLSPISTTVTGSHTTAATVLNVASTTGLSVGEWVTVQGSGAWQSFKIGALGGTTLTIAAGTCSSTYGNTKSSTLAVAVEGGVTVTRCQHRASDSDYFGVLDSATYDEMDYEAANVKAAYPELFLWGPGLAGGHPDSMEALFTSGRSFVGLCDGFNYHAYSINSGYYAGDEQWHSGVNLPDDLGNDPFAREVLALHFKCLKAYRSFTNKPVMCSEWGIAPATARFGTTGHRAYTPQKFAYLFAAATNILTTLDVRHVILWGPDRQGFGNHVNSLDLISQESDMEAYAALLMQGAKAMERSGTPATTVPAGFSNTGASTGVY